MVLFLLAIFAASAFSQKNYTTEYDIPYSAKPMTIPAPG